MLQPKIIHSTLLTTDLSVDLLLSHFPPQFFFYKDSKIALKNGKETICKKIPKNPAGLWKSLAKAEAALSLMFEYY